MTEPSGKTLYIVVTGAALTRRADAAVAAARDRDWQPAVIATPAAESWLPRTELEAANVPLLTDHRQPNDAKRLPSADAVLLAPATFNTINKLATGIADNYAMSVLCEALSTRVRTVLVPFVSTRLAGHPAWLASLAVLRYAGVTLVDPRTGATNIEEPIQSGTGDAVADQFDWNWPLSQLA
ncbi:MAG: flavoprotein [Streptosporangiales bacterium]|nr:flavoprotein [Streptosporangiales bacterium]